MENEISRLYDNYANGEIGRREFMSRATAMGIAGAAAAALGPLAANPAEASALAQAARAAVAAARKRKRDLLPAPT